MKRKLFVVLCFLCLVLSGCSKKEEERVLNVLNWSSYIPDEIVRDFEKKTGIRVNYGTYSSNEELLAKIANSKEGTYDLIFPSDYMIEIMKSRGLLQELDKSKLDNYKNIDSNYLNLSYDSNNRYSLPFVLATVLIAVNRDVISDEVSSYSDLLDSKFKNEIVLLDDQRIVIGMGLLALGYDMNSTNTKEIDEAREFLLELKKNVKAFDSDSPKNFLITGEASIAVIWNAEAALAKKENPNIEIIYPDEGMALSVDNFAILKGSKNTSEAYQFIDYILDGKVMSKIIEAYPYKNVNSEASKYLSSWYLENPAANISSNIIRNGFFVENIGDKIKLYDRTWALIK